MEPQVTAWPGEDRRRPPRSSSTYVVRAPLAAWLAREAEAARRRHGTEFRVLDVGCGTKPYYPLFADAAEYIGVDVAGNEVADVVGVVEEIPLPDAGFEIVLCTQVLEHADDPATGVRELRRVVAPGGRVLLSTHGVQAYHPNPRDLWRWTHEGLETLCRQNGEWSSVTVTSEAGTASCIAMLLGKYAEIGAKRAGIPRAARPAVWTLNTVSEALDARSALLREPRPGSLFANYHVVAEAP